MLIESKIKNIYNEFAENKNSHVFLIETNNIDKALQSLKKLINNILKPSEEIKKQIENETYLEMIIIKPEEKEIKKDQINYLLNRLKIKPIISKYLFYIICNAETMNQNSSNKLLKTIEEPNDNNIGFIITKNIDLILPTIKSRCEIFSLIYEEAEESKEIDEELVFKLIEAIETNNFYNWHILKKQINKEEVQIYIEFIKNIYNFFVEGKMPDDYHKIFSIINSNNNLEKILKKVKFINSFDNFYTKNMNSELKLDKLFIEITR